jgi:hypothetical protein
MNKKVILTEQQHDLIINHILKETVEKIEKLESEGKLDEGLWDTIKYGLSKLGRYKAGGKIFGKGKVDSEYAEKIKNIIEKQGNEMIRQLDAKIKETNPEFPNNEDPQLFLTTIMEIAAVYDSIVAATKLPQNEKGAIPVDVANGIIDDLREYVNKYLDVDLKAIYSTTNEEETSEEDMLTEDQMSKIDEYFGLDEAVPARRNNGQMSSTNQGPQVSGQASAGNYRKNQDIEDADYEDVPNDTTQSPLNAKDVRAGLKSKRGSGEDFASTRMDTLKSNKLPMTLAGVGASLGAFSWLVNTQWFKSLFDIATKNPSIEYIKQAVQEKSDVFASIKPNEGMTQIMNRLNGMNLNPNSSPQEFINGVKALGGGNVNDGINALTQQGGIFANPEAAKKALTEIVSNPNGHGNTLGQVFQGKWAGTGKSLGDALVTQTGGSLKGMVMNTIIKAVPKLVIRTGIKTGAGYALAKGFGAVLGPIGIGLVTAGALVKLMRMKGQKSSRAATLHDLYQSLRNLEGGVLPNDEETGTQDGGNVGGNTGGGQQGGGQINAKSNLYNNLKSLFQFIVNNKNTMGTKTQYNTGTGGASAQAPLSEGKYINDKRVIQYLTKSLPFDKLKNFEDLLNRVEIIRNSLKKMGATTGDKNLDNFLKQLDSNPIMATNFAQLMTVDPNNPQEVNQLLAFIKETLLAVYSGNYKFGGMVDKMSALGGGNINKVSEEEMDEAAGYSASQPNKSFMKDASSRTTFKNNLIKFLSVAMNMFQYLHKTQGGNIARKDTTNKYTAPPSRKQGQGTQQAQPAPQRQQNAGQSSPTGQNVVPESLDPKLMEELKRIKKIMLS